MKRKNILKKILIVLGILIFGVSVAFYIGLQTILEDFSKEVSRIDINNINMSNIDDGIYEGEYFLKESLGARVRVAVKNKKIVNINIIEHRHGKGKRAEVITNSVIDKQSLKVDTVSGATGSSIIILKATENALK